MASWTLSVFYARDSTTILTLYKSMVRSILEYCCPLWNPYKVTDIKRLEGVQRTVTSKITAVKHLNYWERLKTLKLMSLQRRRERYIILLMWKILNNCSPNDIAVEFSQPSRLGIKAKLPPLRKNGRMHHQTMYDNSFAVLGPKLWNAIPADLSISETFDDFKNKLTKFLESFPDNPPTTGYIAVNGNSLLDWRYGDKINDSKDNKINKW